VTIEGEVPSVDIQTILIVIGRQERPFEKGKNEHLNLTETNLDGADLAGAIMAGAHLRYAQLDKAQLENAIFPRANLE
jgi:uncharacterized protein YjbI with pentapeptide repeats